MISTALYSTGISSLDSLIEEVRAGDNFVFNLSSLKWYKPFARALLKYCLKNEIPIILMRVDGSLDDIADSSTAWVDVFDVEKSFSEPEGFKAAFRSNIRFNGKGVFYIIDNAGALVKILGGEDELREFFLVFCPLLEENESLVYWPFIGKKHSSATVAAIKDCAPVFIEIEKQKENLLLRIIKAVGRYSDRMYMAHRISVDTEGIHLLPVPTIHRSLEDYTHELEIKNKELLEIKTIHERAQKELLLRTKELKTINQVALGINRYIERDKILHNALKRTIDAIKVNGGAIFLCDQEQLKFEPAAYRGISAAAVEKFTQPRLWEQLFCKISKFTKPIILYSTDKSDSCWWLSGQKLEGSDILLMAPLRAQGKLVGAMVLVGDIMGRLGDRDFSMLTSIGHQIAISIVHSNLYQRIKNSETRYRNLFESAQDGIFIIDAETGKIQEANAQATALTGYSEKELQSMRFWDLIVKDRRLEVRSYFQNRDFSRQTMNSIPLLRSDESVLMTEVYSNTTQIGGNRLIQCLMRNITSRVKAEWMIREAVDAARALNRKLTEKNTELEEIARSKMEFLNFVSHELRTPLTTLQWAGDRLQRILDAVEIEDTQRLLQIVKEDTGKLMVLVNQLLEFSRIEASRLRLNKQAQLILPLIDNIIKIKKNRIREKKINFRVHAPKNLVRVMFDPQKLEIVFNNLIDNSLKYSFAKGSIKIVVKQNMLPEPNLEVKVKDDGVGIPESDLERVFERFYRGSRTEILKTSGTGLGLSISRAIIEAHGGKIWAEKPPNKGCVIAFTLPMVEE